MGRYQTQSFTYKDFCRIVYYHVPSGKRQKLKDRHTKQILVHYSGCFGKKGYPLKNEATSKSQFNRSCKFPQHPCNKLPQPMPNEDDSLDDPLEIVCHIVTTRNKDSNPIYTILSKTINTYKAKPT